MILRLVCNFFILCFVSGNQQYEDTIKTAKMEDCQHKICQGEKDLVDDHPNLTSLRVSPLPPRVEEDHYGYPAQESLTAVPAATINAEPLVEARFHNVEFMPDENPWHYVPTPNINYVEEDIGNKEKTICFSSSMVHTILKAALEYVSRMPSSVNNIMDTFDQELNRMTESENLEEITVKEPFNPLHFKTVLQMLNVPRSEKNKNFILKYEHPNKKEPHCGEALEKLIEIAYFTYMEMEQHPQCRDYLYNYVSHRPVGDIDRPDLKSLIAIILEQVNKYKVNLDISPDIDRYGNVPSPDLQTPQTFNEYNIPQILEYDIQQRPQIHEYNIPQGPHIHEYNNPQGPQIHEYNNPQGPQIHEYNIPQVHEYNVHKYGELDVQQYNTPQIQEYSIHKTYVPEAQEYTVVPEVPEYINLNNVPKHHEYRFTDEYDVPHIKEYPITENYEYNVPKNLEYQSQEYIPQIQYNEDLQTQESIPEIIRETISIHPENTINILMKVLQNGNQPNTGYLFDHLTSIVEENQNTLNPRIFKTLLNLLNTQKQRNIPRFNDIFLLLLDSQRNSNWPWSERVIEHLLSYLTPDHTGIVDTRIIDILLNLFKTRPNEKQIEKILSLMRSIKEGILDPRIHDIILRLTSLPQNSVMRPDFIDILLKLLKPNLNGIVLSEKVDIVNYLSKWDEMGISPNHLNKFIALLKPYVNGHMDHRLINIVHFLLTRGRYLNPKFLDFILSFLYPEYGIIEYRRIDVIHFLLNNLERYPKHAYILLNFLQTNPNGVLRSIFLEILLFLDNNELLNPELVHIIINLLTNDVTGQLNDQHVKNLFFRLASFKQFNPKVVEDVLRLLNKGGLHNNIVLETFDNNDLTRDSNSADFKLELEEVQKINPGLTDYRTPDHGYIPIENELQSPDHDFVSIFKWLDSQGLLTQDQGSNANLVNQILKILEVGQRESGAVELTYMLKHEKPLIYQPVYYVKYRLPILSFISNMKNLLLENPHLNSDPMKLLHELIVISNLTEVSPNLQGYPKEEILKLTFSDGDLVQAKILDEQNSVFNNQIKYVHSLNADISPEEIWLLNKMNEERYFSNFMEVEAVQPDKLIINEVDRFMDLPPVHYQNIELKPAIGQPTESLHHKMYIARANQKQDAIDHEHALPRSQD